MTSKTLGLICMGAAALAIAGCSSSSTPNIPPAAPVTAEPLAPLPTGPLTAPQISQALSERTFNFSSPGRKGTISFYKDGTFEYQEAGKGNGTGVWQASAGKLCEARNPTTFLPKGTPSVCVPFTSDGTKFTSGNMQLIPG